MRADVLGYIKQQADTKEYLRPAPVAEQGRRLPLEPLSWAEMIRYTKRLTDIKEYLRLAPVTKQSRCMGACADRSVPVEAILIIPVTHSKWKILQNSSPQLLLCHPSTELTRLLKPLFWANEQMHGAL